jgi:hypothetical protein
MWNLVLVCLEIVLVSVPDRCMISQMYHKLRNYFGRTGWYSLVKWVMWNLLLLYLKTMLVSEQDRCTLCAKHTIGSQIILGTPDGTPR